MEKGGEVLRKVLTGKGGNPIRLLQGDLFFSQSQTITITTNCVGVMGAGLASRAKDLFPDVYNEFRKACRKGLIHLGKPYLYKRERENDTWFLLFPTKNHWKEKASLDGIKKGLEWLKANYKKEEIRSIALPALGCGLGKLDWSIIGPLMVSALYEMDIPAEVYLPADKEVPEEQLSESFLLPQKS